MRAGSRKSRRSAGPPPAARQWIPGALSGHDDQPQQKSQRGAAFTPEKKTRKGTRRQTVESKTTKIIEEKACDTHEEGNGEEQQERHKNVGNEQKKKKKIKSKGILQAREKLPSSHAAWEAAPIVPAAAGTRRCPARGSGSGSPSPRCHGTWDARQGVRACAGLWPSGFTRCFGPAPETCGTERDPLLRESLTRARRARGSGDALDVPQGTPAGACLSPRSA